MSWRPLLLKDSLTVGMKIRADVNAQKPPRPKSAAKCSMDNILVSMEDVVLKMHHWVKGLKGRRKKNCFLFISATHNWCLMQPQKKNNNYFTIVVANDHSLMIYQYYFIPVVY